MLRAVFSLALLLETAAGFASPGIVTVRPKESDDVLVNPGIGFTTFQRFNGDRLNDGLGWTEGFPIDYQPFTGTLTNKDHLLTSIAYFRVYWKFVEPEAVLLAIISSRYQRCTKWHSSELVWIGETR